MVFVTGEVGIGKTTLVDAFVTAIRGHDDIWVGRGQCIEHHGSGEAYRLQGELLLRHAIPDTAQAEACFQKALAIARHEQARSWELRVAMSLARLWQQQGKGAAAYQVLAEVYSWFTEGFETAALQEAKTHWPYSREAQAMISPANPISHAPHAMASEFDTTVTSGANTSRTVASLTHWLQARVARSHPLAWLRYHT